MLEVMQYVFRLSVCEWCIVWVCREVFLTSHAASIVRVRSEMARLCKVFYECVCLLFVRGGGGCCSCDCCM